jgi:uncharacterized membrane protein
VLDLRPPETSFTYADLVAQWPHLFAFTLTFLVGGTFWISHHSLFDAIVRNNRSLLWLNLIFLSVVSLLPFTTNLLGGHGGTLAWVVYAGNMVLIGLSLTAIWGYATAAGLVDSSLGPDASRYELGQLLLLPAVFFVSIPLAFIAPGVAPYTPLLTPLVYRLYVAVAGGGLEAERRPAGPKARRWVLLGFLPVIVFAGWTVWLNVTGQF